MRHIGLMTAALALTACGDGSAANSPESPATSRVPAAQSADRNQPGRRTFRDWYAVCDNANTCYAFGHAGEGSGWVRVAIPAGPEGKASVMLGLWPEDEAFTGPPRVEVDGQAFAAQVATDDEAYGSLYATVVGQVSPSLIAAMSQGEAMTIAAGMDIVPISLSGAAAAMLWIDERQGRVGTTTALLRQGSRPASSVPAVPALPIVTPAAAIEQAPYGDQEGQRLPAAVAALPEVVECYAEIDFNSNLRDTLVSARLDVDTVLWAVPCGAGAYNFATAYFTTRPDGTNPRRLTFPSTGEPEVLLTNAGYDPATRMIEDFNKGRGLGDCGTASSWTWTARGFVLTAASGMPDCVGVPMTLWPTYWVAR